MEYASAPDELALIERPGNRAITDDDQMCCFGMVVDLVVKLSCNYEIRETPIHLDVMEDSSTLFDPKAKSKFGSLNLRATKILAVLRKELVIQIFAHSLPNLSKDLLKGSITSNGKTKQARSNPSIGLYVILYGPSGLAQHVGDFTARCSLYLQPPLCCNRNVPYQNPHCLSPLTSEKVYTYELLNGILEEDLVSTIETYLNPIDLFADSTEQEAIPDTESPEALRTKLYKHQKQALTFMMQRERGWATKSHQRDIWKEENDALGRVVYFNTVSGQRQFRPPKQFRGGLLTDAPGLGKSLSIIALIALTVENRGNIQHDESSSNTTLLIVPKTLIQTWKDELEKHLSSSNVIKFCVYYGKDKTKYLADLSQYTLVITTYSVVRLDWKTNSSEPSHRLFLHSVRWKRIVLDEAHIIREPSKSFAQSVCALEAECRWAVTGTPIQNRLRDLFSLFKFLQCSPFDDLKTFNTQIAQKWKARSDPNCVAKLKTLVNCLSLRRPKTIIELPPRCDVTSQLEFTEEEWQYYEKVQAVTKRTIDAATGENGGATFINALQWVNELRLICNHGVKSGKITQDLPNISANVSRWTEQEAQARFNHLDQVGLAKCSNPECCNDLSSALSSETDTEHADEPRLEESLELLCSLCFHARSGRAGKFFKVCNHLPRRPLNIVALGTQQKLADEKSTTASLLDFTSGGIIPSKIKRLVQDLSETPEDVKSVVFSSWTKTFDIIQPVLMNKGIRCVRLDGTLSASSRISVIRVFRANPGIKVLLATITCGGIGLDLTAASRAYIMEPQWNPMSESQALDRIHRLGQLKEVKTIKYVMKKSWEEQVLKLQCRKQELADLTLSGGVISRAELTQGRLQYLKELVG